MAMGLGAGLLIAVVSYSLVLETIEDSGRPIRVAIGIAVGAAAYYIGDVLIARSTAGKEGGSGLSLALGAVLDGIPESLVIGISVALTGAASIPLVVAAFIANISESLGGTEELEKVDPHKAQVFLAWFSIAGASVLAAILGHQVIADMTDAGGAVFNGFAGGAVLMVLATAMIPEGYEKAGRRAGAMVVLGFAAGFALEHL